MFDKLFGHADDWIHNGDVASLESFVKPDVCGTPPACVAGPCTLRNRRTARSVFKW